MGDDPVTLGIDGWIRRSIGSLLVHLDVTIVPKNQRIESPCLPNNLTRSGPLSFDDCIGPIISLSLPLFPPLLLSLALLLLAEEEFGPLEPLPLSLNCFSNSSTCIDGGRLVFNGRLRKWSVRRWRPPGGGLCVCIFEPPGRRFRRLFPRIGALHGVRPLKALVVMIDVSTAAAMGSTGTGRFFDDDLEETRCSVSVEWVKYNRLLSLLSNAVDDFFLVFIEEIEGTTILANQIFEIASHFIVDLVSIGRRFILPVINIIQQCGCWDPEPIEFRGALIIRILVHHREDQTMLELNIHRFSFRKANIHIPVGIYRRRHVFPSIDTSFWRALDKPALGSSLFNDWIILFARSRIFCRVCRHCWSSSCGSKTSPLPLACCLTSLSCAPEGSWERKKMLEWRESVDLTYIIDHSIDEIDEFLQMTYTCRWNTEKVAKEWGR